MKNILRFCLAFALSVGFVSNSHAQETESSKGKIIISVNTPWGIGYFADADGNLLFNKQFEAVEEFVDGLAKVKLGGKWGFINTSGDVVIPCIHDEVLYLDTDKVKVKYKGKWGAVNTSGEVMIPYIYDVLYYECSEQDCETYYHDIVYVMNNEKWGIINAVGEVIIPCVCDNMISGDDYGEESNLDVSNLLTVHPCSCPHSDIIDGIKVQYKGKWGYIATDGKSVVPFIYDDIRYYYTVIDQVGVQLNDKWGLVSTSGDTIIPFIYDDVDYYNGTAHVMKNGKCGLMDWSGKVIIPCLYDEIDWWDLCSDYSKVKVKQNDKWGIVNSSGKLVIPCLYDDIRFSDSNEIQVQYNGKWGVINMAGKVIVPFVHDQIR